MNRRKFIKNISFSLLSTLFYNSIIFGKENKYKAFFFEKLNNNKVRCHLCPNNCILSDGRYGVCRVRKNVGGELFSMNYSEIAAIHIDPIEKKPLFHFKPGAQALSIASAGCNLRCKFCQNWEISQFKSSQLQTRTMEEMDLIAIGKDENIPIIAYTYSEPIIFYEFMYNLAKVSREYGVQNVMISAGFINKEPLKKLFDVLDAIKIDLKSFSDDYYRKICGGRLKPVLDNLVEIKKNGIWLEIVYLIVPTLNDSDDEIRSMVRWVKQNLGTDVPLHFSRFYPQYKMKNLPPTPVKTIERACEIAYNEGLNYVYAGNIPGNKYENTYCPKCGAVLIQRYGYYILQKSIVSGKCKNCGQEIAGVWM